MLSGLLAMTYDGFFNSLARADPLLLNAQLAYKEINRECKQEYPEEQLDGF
jgi:hypothetical protein